VAADCRLSMIEDTQALILGALNMLPNQLATVFSTQLLAANPPRTQQQQQQGHDNPVVPCADQVSYFYFFLYFSLFYCYN
jgi:hypothetical protein